MPHSIVLKLRQKSPTIYNKKKKGGTYLYTSLRERVNPSSEAIYKFSFNPIL
jgi:uncharacterized protein YcgL (UPF0745 family)